MSVTPPAVTTHRSWPRRLLITFNVLCVIGAVTTAGILGYSNKQLSEVTRVGLNNVLRPSNDVPPGQPVNYLLVGADSGSGLAADDPVNNGRAALDGTFRTDTIMVLHIDPRNSTAQLLSFPRDLWVSIPGETTKHRINEAVENGGGAPRLIETITQDFGIPIDHYVQVDFASFETLVNAIGGVPVYFPDPARAGGYPHPSTSFSVAAGCTRLNGGEALAFVRVRKDYEVQINGRWKFDQTGDLGRIARQQFFIQTALQEAIAKGVRNPTTLRELVDIGVVAVKLDTNLKLDDILNLGSRFRNFNPSTLVKYTFPSVEAVHGGADVLDPQMAAAAPLLALFQGTGGSGTASASTTSLSPSMVKMQVQNGGEIKGEAGSVTTDFNGLGFSTITPIDAPDKITGTIPTVEYPAGGLAKARYVARYIVGGVNFVQTSDVTGVDVVVVIPTNFAGTLTKPKADSAVPIPSTTSTTAPAATTTTTTTTIPIPTTTVDPFIPQNPPAGQGC